DKSKGGYWSEGKHWSEILADETITYMEENKDSKEPLFMFCAFNAPHDPRQAPKEYVDMYDVDKISVPQNFLPVHPLGEQMKSGKNLRDEQLAPFPRTHYSVQKHRQEYYALITHMDAQVGRIIEALKRNGLDKNTLIVFASDNGLSVGHHGLIGKQSMYDHSAKVPLAFCGLGLPTGEVRNQLIYLQDLVPTVYDLVGIKKPNHLEFISQINALKSSKASSHRKAIYSAYLQEAQRMVTDGHYKLFFIPASKDAYLFDLEKDPQETNNLFGSPQYKRIVKRLCAEYQKLSKESGDTFNLAAIYPELFQ
ncbi:sulfatase-like hydrolase/transferase, partial [Bacteroides cellulosilyticus]